MDVERMVLMLRKRLMHTYVMKAISASLNTPDSRYIQGKVENLGDQSTVTGHFRHSIYSHGGGEGLWRSGGAPK